MADGFLHCVLQADQNSGVHEACARPAERLTFVLESLKSAFAQLAEPQCSPASEWTVGQEQGLDPEVLGTINGSLHVSPWEKGKLLGLVSPGHWGLWRYWVGSSLTSSLLML